VAIKVHEWDLAGVIVSCAAREEDGDESSTTAAWMTGKARPCSVQQEEEMETTRLARIMGH
jgi:hypothetical protein